MNARVTHESGDVPRENANVIPALVAGIHRPASIGAR
jgi:hypothetical protein